MGLSTVKGLFFVAASAILLYAMIYKSVRDTVFERDSYYQRLSDLSLNANDIILLEDED